MRRRRSRAGRALRDLRDFVVMMFCLFRFSPRSGLLTEPLAGYGVVFRVKFDAEIGAPEHLGGHQGRAGTAEGVEHHAAWRRKSFDHWQKHREGLLRGMELVAAVGPVDNVADGVGWLFRVAFGEEIGAFVLVAQEFAGRGVALGENEVPDDAEASGAVRLHEPVDVRPSVEADTEAVPPQDAEHLGKRWLEPGGVIIVRDGAAVPRFIVGDVWRVR